MARILSVSLARPINNITVASAAFAPGFHLRNCWVSALL